MTVLEAVVKIFSWFSKHPGISKEALSDSLHMQHHEILPPGNLLPDSYTAAHQLIDPYLVRPILFDACPNDCLIFRGNHTDDTECMTCGAHRFVKPNVPAKRFQYLPVGPRLQRLFGTANLAQIVQSHGSEDSTTVMQDVHDSPAWRQMYSPKGVFAGDRRGISLALCTDGLNPYSQNRVSYSMWPILLAILNLPRKIRYSFIGAWKWYKGT